VPGLRDAALGRWAAGGDSRARFGEAHPFEVSAGGEAVDDGGDQAEAAPGSSLLFEGRPPRAVRSMIERWVPSLPFVSTFFARLGQVLGTPENCRTLLEQDEAVLVFPEGVRGINKTYDKA
jgi:hypothetical protein